MYDVKSEAREFVAETSADARAKAMQFFGLEESQITFRELDAGEVSGAGSRTVVVAQPTEMVGGATDGGRDRGRDRETRGRERGPARERAGRGRGERERDRGGERPERGERDRSAAPREPSAPSVGTAKGEIGAIGEFILGVVERMDIGPFELGESEEGRFVVYELSGAAAEELTAGDSRATEAIQLLANQAAGRLSEDPKRIVVDVAGDREIRESFLARMAERAARRAADTGRAVALDPMNGRDRRGIHMALRDAEGIATMSIGEGRYRQVVVVPEGAPEYEEALESARDSSSAQED
jgi:spoIIIJ-associated protein